MSFSLLHVQHDEYVADVAPNRLQTFAFPGTAGKPMAAAVNGPARVRGR